MEAAAPRASRLPRRAMKPAATSVARASDKKRNLAAGSSRARASRPRRAIASSGGVGALLLISANCTLGGAGAPPNKRDRGPTEQTGLRPTEQSQLVLRAGARQGIVEFVSLDADRVQRVVLGLPEVALRVEWLRDYLESTPTDRAARELERMCEASERSDPLAREAVLALALLCARFGEETIVGRLRARAEEARLLDRKSTRLNSS